MATPTLAPLFAEILKPFAPANYPKPQPEFLVFPTGNKKFHWKIVGVNSGRMISQHVLLVEALRKCAVLNRGQQLPALGFCEHETPESSWGACDGGFKCTHLGTVHHLDSERDLCPKHFELAVRAMRDSEERFR